MTTEEGKKQCFPKAYFESQIQIINKIKQLNIAYQMVKDIKKNETRKEIEVGRLFKQNDQENIHKKPLIYLQLLVPTVAQ